MIRSAFILLSLICASVAIPLQTPLPDDAPFRISVDLDLVTIPVTVRDRKGQNVPGLAADSFEIYEDKVRQNIRLFRTEDIPVTAGLVVDHSGSMQPRMQDVTAAAQAFARKSNPSDEIFVLNFNERVVPGLPPSLPFSNDPEQLGAAILNAPIAGNTALYDALDTALDRVGRGTRTKKVLVLISDGGDNASHTQLPVLMKKIARLNITIYAIGIFNSDDADSNVRVLRNLVHATGGEAYFPASHDVPVVCERIAASIRQQYTLGYVSTNKRGTGKYRRIQVFARAGKTKLYVHARAGYIAEVR